jgi:hypothetical protein
VDGVNVSLFGVEANIKIERWHHSHCQSILLMLLLGNFVIKIAIQCGHRFGKKRISDDITEGSGTTARRDDIGLFLNSTFHSLSVITATVNIAFIIAFICLRIRLHVDTCEIFGVTIKCIVIVRFAKIVLQTRLMIQAAVGD